MKLKYYLRGLGTGILISVLILAVSYNHQGSSVSDTEIRKRAADLGMVMQDTSVLTQEKTAKTEPAKQAKKTEPAKQTEQVKQTESAASEEPLSTASSADAVNESIPSQEGSKQESTAVSEKSGALQVKSGDSSVSVSKRAQQAGYVESAAKFDTYLCKNGYDKHICVGSYQIPQGATQEQIAKIITRS